MQIRQQYHNSHTNVKDTFSLSSSKYIQIITRYSGRQFIFGLIRSKFAFVKL